MRGNEWNKVGPIALLLLAFVAPTAVAWSETDGLEDALPMDPDADTVADGDVSTDPTDPSHAEAFDIVAFQTADLPWWATPVPLTLPTEEEETEDDDGASTTEDASTQPSSTPPPRQNRPEEPREQPRDGSSQRPSGGPLAPVQSVLGALPVLPVDELVDDVRGLVTDPPVTVPSPPVFGPVPDEQPLEPMMAPTSEAPVAAGPGLDLVVAVGAVAAAATVAVALAAHAATGSVLPKLTMLRRTLGAALYARLAKSQLLDHDTRGEILTYLHANPGACLTDVQAAFPASMNTIRHHLRVLESNGLLHSVKSGRKRCYFAADRPLGIAARRAMAALSTDAARRVFHTVRERPGIRQRELAATLGVSPTSVIFQVRRLEDAGVLRKARAGRETAYWPGESVPA